VLSDADDEILFVDYNIPTTSHLHRRRLRHPDSGAAKSRLRVFRARPQQIPYRQAESTSPPSIRNPEHRHPRSNPRNRWLLFTNSDMIFLPREGVADLTAAVRDLSDGLYIPAPIRTARTIVETFPEAIAAAILEMCSHLGARPACG